jgi:hypothetical protein
MPWTSKIPVMIPWGIWGTAALALRLGRYFEYGLETVVLYGWIMFFFFGDGLFALIQTLTHLPAILRSRKIQKNAAKGKWVWSFLTSYADSLPDSSEREFIAHAMKQEPGLSEFYEEMLRKEPPFIHRLLPLGFTGWIKRLFLGPVIPMPSLVFELGTDPFDDDAQVPDIETRPTGYLLNGSLWFSEPRFAWGELEGLGDGITVLSPDPDVDSSTIPMLSHDNIYRPTIRISAARRYYFLGRLMLWGIIWIIGMDSPLEDLIGGTYLFFGLPLFLRLSITSIQSYIGRVLERFKNAFYSPKVDIVHSPLLEELERDHNTYGQLNHADEYGFGHLREFYRRAAWQKRWKVREPTGQGVIDA